MADTYGSNINRYTNYFTSVVRNIDVYLQEDQLMHTKCGFPLVALPTYLPISYELSQSKVCCIEDAVYSEAREVEQEMLIIMEEHPEDKPHDLSNASVHSSFSRLCLFQLNIMGYGLNRISPITFDEDAFQTPDNRMQSRAPTSTPRKKGKQSSSQVASW